MRAPGSDVKSGLGFAMLRRLELFYIGAEWWRVVTVTGSGRPRDHRSGELGCVLEIKGPSAGLNTANEVPRRISPWQPREILARFSGPQTGITEGGPMGRRSRIYDNGESVVTGMIRFGTLFP